jgi:beta-aspartyl-peptidase (threonine type)
VGDSPLLGCGTYADEFSGVSCTGDGEAIMRLVLAKVATELVRSGLEPFAAAQQAIEQLGKKTGGIGGLIVIDRYGRIGRARNTSHMPVSFIQGGITATHY